MGRQTLVRRSENPSRGGDPHPTPRCSTPVFDPCVGSRRPIAPFLPLADEEGETPPMRRRNDGELYREWKLRLHRGKTRLFKVRGARNRAPTQDCSIISGHFEPEVVLRSGIETAAAAAPPQPAPLCQMWFPFGYPGFWTPAHNCQPQNPVWHGGVQPGHHHPRYHATPTRFFTPAQCFFFANLCQGYQTAQFAGYHGYPYHQMHQAQPQYRFFDGQPFPSPAGYPPPQFVHRGIDPVAFPVTMAS